MGTLDGRSAIVTGGANGLGRAFAERLAAEGADVTLCDVDDGAPEVASAMGGPGRVQGLVADVSSLDDLRRLVDAACEAYGGVDLLVNNAGRWGRTPVTDSYGKALEDWDFIMGTNFMGVLLLSRLCIPLMIERGGGDIVNLSTYYVLPAKSAGTNAPDTDIYNASKWALNGFTQSWANSLEEHGIRVNALCMGAVDTPMLQGLVERRPTRRSSGFLDTARADRRATRRPVAGRTQRREHRRLGRGTGATRPAQAGAPDGDGLNGAPVS